MKRWSRRLLYLTIIAIWLIAMIFPLFAIVLAARGEMNIGDDVGNHLRFHLVQEKGAEGVSVEWTRPLRQQPTCSQTTVNYFMWEGYCQCDDTLASCNLP